MDRTEYIRDYHARNIIQKKLVFNRTVAEDLKLLEWLETRQNFNSYCKELIRDDMIRNKFTVLLEEH